MADITIIDNPSEEHLQELGVRSWPTWSAQVSTFPWTYDEPETCFFLEGDVVVSPEGGDPVQVRKGQLVTFPAGMSCTWHVRKPVHKHYRFG
jgi:uncharacterized cupin superfamily protein